MDDIIKNDIVQIINEQHRWFPCLIVADEIKPWGIQGYIVIPTNDTEPNARAYTRLEFSDIQKVGRAEIITEDYQEER